MFVQPNKGLSTKILQHHVYSCIVGNATLFRQPFRGLSYI